MVGLHLIDVHCVEEVDSRIPVLVPVHILKMEDNMEDEHDEKDDDVGDDVGDDHDRGSNLYESSFWKAYYAMVTIFH